MTYKPRGGLTIKQERFVRAYLRTGNATAAYREAYVTSGMADTTVNRMYYNSEGITADYLLAHMWFNLAAAGSSRGKFHDWAVRDRDEVEERMSPAQVAEAQRLAREWKPK